jgi:SHS family lactate transporter-like MFS transporter
MGLKFGMASFIAGGALIVIAISVFNTSRWMPKDLTDETVGAPRGGSVGEEGLAAGNAAH